MSRVNGDRRRCSKYVVNQGSYNLDNWRTIAPMTSHTFDPDHYHQTIGSHEPVLRINDGDTVTTTTVDARGVDRHQKQVTPPGNPQTGPFFVEGAEPGDTLVVHLDDLSPNRETGWSSTVIASNVVDPDYVREMP